MNGDVRWRRLCVDTTERLGGASDEARWLCQEASGLEGLDWIEGLDEPATERAVARLDAMVARRLTGEPLQYVLGHWPFRGLDLMVDRKVLIPRPETEQVVEVALELLKGRPRPLLIADLGTGSGAIALSLAAELPVDGVEIWATDISPDALDVARANLAGLGRVGANVRLAHGDWFEALPADLRGRLDLVVANPPYVAESDELGSEVRDWEPLGALLAGPDGLDALRRIVTESVTWLAPGGWLVLEIGSTQSAVVSTLVATRGLVDGRALRDLATKERTIVGRSAAGPPR